jgi:ATP-dependent Clp protease protease subunit
VEAALERDRYMAPEDAKAWGLVDHVYSDRGELELSLPQPTTSLP